MKDEIESLIEAWTTEAHEAEAEAERLKMSYRLEEAATWSTRAETLRECVDRLKEVIQS